MKPAYFIIELQEKIQTLENLVKENMPDKGLKCEDSQKICLLNAISKLDHLSNGVEESDFEKV